MSFNQHFERSQVDSLKSLNWDTHQLGHWIKPFSVDQLIGLEKLPLLTIVGIAENEEEEVIIEKIRKSFYSLFWHLPDCLISDCGNLHNYEMDEWHIILSKLIDLPTVVLLLCPRPEKILAVYRSFIELKRTVNLLYIDNTCRFGKFDEALSDNNFISKLISNEPNYLFNISYVGYQTYLNNPSDLSAFEKFNFDLVRLGLIRENSRILEPLARNADFAILSCESLRSCDFTTTNQSPNGLTPEEFCQIARYSGLSNKLSSLQFSGFGTHISSASIQLIAQAMWFFADGIHARIDDGSISDDSIYITYKVAVSIQNTEIVFYKNRINGRWWMKVPLMDDTKNRFRRHQIIPCLYDDYKQALEGEIPENWWKAFQKLM